jgi:hypothetical protein
MSLAKHTDLTIVLMLWLEKNTSAALQLPDIKTSKNNFKDIYVFLELLTKELNCFFQFENESIIEQILTKTIKNCFYDNNASHEVVKMLAHNLASFIGCLTTESIVSTLFEFYSINNYVNYIDSKRMIHDILSLNKLKYTMQYIKKVLINYSKKLTNIEMESNIINLIETSNRNFRSTLATCK